MKIKRLISTLLALSFIVSLIGIPNRAFAVDQDMDNSMSYPLKATYVTDKEFYGTLDTATFRVNIENVGTNAVENISAQSSFESLQPVGNNGELYIDGKTLAPGESVEYSFSATIRPTKINFFLRIFLVIKNFFQGKREIIYNDFNDGRSFTESSVEVSFGNYDVSDTLKVWYDYKTEVIQTNSTDDFIDETSKLISAQMNSVDFNLEEAFTNPYYSGRVIVDSSTNIDFTKYNPDKIIANNDGVSILQFSNDEAAEQCVDSLNTLSVVDYAEPDVIMEAESFDAQYVESTFSGASNWGKGYIKADSYEYYLENNNFFDMITVAVIDTGVDLDHSFLKNRITSNGYDLVDGDTVADDENGHGTHVAGIVSDCTDGLNVKILPIRVLNSEGSGYSSIIGQGIRYAANNGADVINLSLGGGKSDYIDSAVEYAVEKKGVVVCVAAGNGDERNNPVDTKNISPANCKDAIVVGAIDKNGKIASFSNYGSSVDVVAPGVDVYSAYKNGNYAKLSGTSMASPHIAATAAMFKLANDNLSPKEIEELIKDYCKDLGATGRDDKYGHGVVNMYNAIPDCTVRFDSNGGSSVADKNVKNTDEITLPIPKKSYTVKLNANGGSISQSVYTRNCELEGWYKSSSLTGVRYAPDELYMAKSTEVLYAKWINPNLGAVNTPTRANYKFLGWYTSATGGSEYTSASKINSNITLYAHWEQIKKQIPDYNNWDVNSAIHSLTSLGMKYTTSYAYNNNYASGKVYGQSAAANSVIPVGSTVTLYVSSGPREIAVGDYIYYHGGTTLYKTIAGGLKNGVYKADPSGGYCTGIYTYNGTVYYQFQYYGASDPFGWAPAYYFSLV